MKPGDELYTLECEVIHSTGKATLVADLATGERLWIPKSHIAENGVDYKEIEGRKIGRVVMSAWIAKQKGLI